MKVLDNYQCEGQITIFEILNPDTWCGKTYQEPLVQTKERTSDVSLKKFAELKIKPPQYLCLKRENGVVAVASWVTGGALLGDYTMRSFGEYPSEEKESRLSQILEDNPHPKYCLSEKACQGILNRANRRGKKLPEQLEQALKCSKFINADNSGKSQTLLATDYKEPQMICLEGNGCRDSHRGEGYKESDTMYTLNTVEQHGVCYGLDRASFNQGKNAQYDFSVQEEIAQPLVARGPGGY